LNVAQRSKDLGVEGGWAPGFALREESPTIVRHLADGCPTCNAGLQAFHHTGSDAVLAPAALQRFEQELAAGLAGAGTPVEALHAALADLALRRGDMLAGR
jgi:hypothetical protein